MSEGSAGGVTAVREAARAKRGNEVPTAVLAAANGLDEIHSGGSNGREQAAKETH